MLEGDKHINSWSSREVWGCWCSKYSSIMPCTATCIWALCLASVKISLTTHSAWETLHSFAWKDSFWSWKEPCQPQATSSITPSLHVPLFSSPPWSLPCGCAVASVAYALCQPEREVLCNPLQDTVASTHNSYHKFIFLSMETIHRSFLVILLHHHPVLHTLLPALIGLTDLLVTRQLPLRNDQLQTQDTKCTTPLAV